MTSRENDLLAPEVLISNQLGEGMGRLIEGSAYLLFTKSLPGMIIFFNTSYKRKQPHKLFIDIKS